MNTNNNIQCRQHLTPHTYPQPPIIKNDSFGLRMTLLTTVVHNIPHFCLQAVPIVGQTIYICLCDFQDLFWLQKATQPLNSIYSTSDQISQSYLYTFTNNCEKTFAPFKIKLILFFVDKCHHHEREATM